MCLLGIVHEMQVVSSLERNHELRPRRAFKDFEHPLQWQKRVIFCNQEERCNAARPIKVQ
jgi:hypothetical protein